MVEAIWVSDFFYRGFTDFKNGADYRAADFPIREIRVIQ